MKSSHLNLLALVGVLGIALVGCDRVKTKGTGSGPRDVGNENGPGSFLGNGQRVALIIGNGKYKNLPKLDACPRDAEQMAEALQKIGVKVHGGKPLVNLTTNQMDAALNAFAATLDRESEAFIYYSGHGTQMGGGNYLLPVDFDAQFESQAKREAIALDDILALLEKTPSRLRVVILDACRDPGAFLPGEPALKGLHSKGLGEQRVDAPETLVCFATKHGTAALADDSSSYYSRVLAEEIVKPGKVEEVMKAVARRVYAETERKQLPFTYGSLLQDHFFVAPAAVVATMPVPQVDVEAEVQRRLRVEMARLSTPAPPVNPTAASKESPFVNSLGMKFVPVAGTTVFFSIWDTRVQDYDVFANETKWEWKNPDFQQGPTHPAVMVSWKDGQAFCGWLSKKEGRTYRLPTDAEWSVAVGLEIESGSTPQEKDGKGVGYPWGGMWPPPKGAGNYNSSLAVDNFNNTSPVGSFAANRNGLYDMGGNVWQWCGDSYDAKKESRVLRGASWYLNDEVYLRSSFRDLDLPSSCDDDYGFRCVLVVPGG